MLLVPVEVVVVLEMVPPVGSVKSTVEPALRVSAQA